MGDAECWLLKVLVLVKPCISETLILHKECWKLLSKTAGSPNISFPFPPATLILCLVSLLPFIPEYALCINERLPVVAVAAMIWHKCWCFGDLILLKHIWMPALTAIALFSIYLWPLECNDKLISFIDARIIPCLVVCELLMSAFCSNLPAEEANYVIRIQFRIHLK